MGGRNLHACKIYIGAKIVLKGDFAFANEKSLN